MCASAGAAVSFDALPFHPGAFDFARQSVFPGGAFANREFYDPHVRFEADLDENDQLLCFGPETSGGLLLARQQPIG